MYLKGALQIALYTSIGPARHKVKLHYPVPSVKST